MKTIIIIAIFACSVTVHEQSTYQPFQTNNPQRTLGTPRSFEQPQQSIRKYQAPPDMNIQIRPGYGDKPKAYDLNTGEQLNVQPRTLGGYDITRY